MDRVALLLFDGADLLDVGGPYEVLLTAARLVERRDGHVPLEVVTVSPDGAPVTAYGGLGLIPSLAAAEVDDLAAVVVPGAVDVPTVLADRPVVDAVQRLAGRSRIVASVCTGSFLLAEAGLLRDRPATTHHEDLAALGARADVGRAVTGRRWVDDGDVVTAGGLSSGIALGLHLVDRWYGRDLAVSTAAQLEYRWDPDGHLDTE